MKTTLVLRALYVVVGLDVCFDGVAMEHTRYVPLSCVAITDFFCTRERMYEA